MTKAASADAMADRETSRDARDEERSLLAACVAGDRQAGDAFVRRYSSLVYHAARRVLYHHGIPHTTEDLADLHHTVFLHLFEDDRRKLRQFRGDNGCGVATWLRTVATRVVLNQLRRRGPDSLVGGHFTLDVTELAGLGDDAANPLERLADSERQELYRRAIDALSESEKLLFRLHIERELSLPEVARLMDITPQNAYTRKHRLIQKLRDQLASSAG